MTKELWIDDEDDFDFANYGKARSMGLSPEKALAVTKIKKIIEKDKRRIKLK